MAASPVLGPERSTDIAVMQGCEIIQGSQSSVAPGSFALCMHGAPTNLPLVSGLQWELSSVNPAPADWHRGLGLTGSQGLAHLEALGAA